MNQESSCRDELRNGAVGSLRHFNDGWENNGETKDNTLIMRNNLDEIICERNAWLSETDCNKLLNQVRICNGQQISLQFGKALRVVKRSNTQMNRIERINTDWYHHPRFCPSSISDMVYNQQRAIRRPNRPFN